MKFVLLSDVHLLYDNPIARKDIARETQLEKLSYIFQYAHDNDCVVLQAGDLFDKPRSWRVLSSIISVIKFTSMPICAVYGQHDMYLYNEENKNSTALGILAAANYIEILDSTTHCYGNCDIYGCSYGQEVPRVKRVKGRTNILVTHRSISMQVEHGTQDLAHQFIRKYKEYDLILCGDIHKHFVYKLDGRIIVNTGPLLRKEATQAMVEHHPCFYVFDSNTGALDSVEIPHRPSEEVLSFEHLEKQNRTNKLLEEFVTKIKTDEVPTVSFIDNLLNWIEKNNMSDEVKIIIDNLVNKVKE